MAQLHQLYIRNMLSAIAIGWLWTACSRLLDRLEYVWTRSFGPANLHLEDLPDLIGPEAEFEEEKSIGRHGMHNSCRFFDARMDIEHSSTRQKHGMVEVVLVTRRYHRGLQLVFLNGELRRYEQLNPRATLSTEINEYEELALALFMQRLREISPLPTGRPPH